VKILWWKVGFTPRTTGHVAPIGWLEPQVLSKIQSTGHLWVIRVSQLGPPCSIHILKTPFFEARSTTSAIIHS
jgi:hypothetical protein